MKNNVKYLIVLFSGLFITSCNSKTENRVVTPIEVAAEVKTAESQSGYKKGEQIPNELVCMVNDAYMGKKQIEVPFEGKTYYGCCNMCVERIPNDAVVRSAIDPFTGKKVDKATAYIVLLNEQGDVAYFESKNNYDNFSKENK